MYQKRYAYSGKRNNQEIFIVFSNQFATESDCIFWKSQHPYPGFTYSLHLFLQRHWFYLDEYHLTNSNTLPPIACNLLGHEGDPLPSFSWQFCSDPLPENPIICLVQ